MTVPSQTPRNLSTAAPGATEFPYDFKILEASHLLVQVDGVTKALNVDYTVGGVGTDSGGAVTFNSPLTGGESVLRKRNMPFSRSIDYQQLGDFGSATMNNDQDAPVMMIQQVADDLQAAIDGSTFEAVQEAVDAAAAAVASAVSATASEASASASASAASGSADAAAASADAAAASGRIYADTSAGLAASTDGQYFYVPSGSADESLILYVRTNSTTATEVKRLPSSALISSIESDIADLGGVTATGAAVGAAQAVPSSPSMYRKVVVGGVPYALPLFAWREPLDLFVIVGQSNAEGRGNSAQSPAVTNGAYISGSTITPTLADPVGGASTGSMWPAFANEWFAQTGRWPAFVESATGGTALIPDQAGSNWSPSGTLRGNAVTAANQAIAAIAASTTFAPANVYFVWAQGEQESETINGTTITGPLYEQALEDLADYFKAQVPSMAQMFVIRTGSRNDRASAANWAAIRTAQENACNDSANLRMVYRGTYSFAADARAMMADSVHYNQSGLNIAGKCAAREASKSSPTAEPAAPTLLATETFMDTDYTTTASSRTVSHTTASGTKMVVVAVATGRASNNTNATSSVTFGGVAMTKLASAAGANASPAGRSDVSIWTITEAQYGGSLSGVTANIVGTWPLAANIASFAAYDLNAEGIPSISRSKNISGATGTDLTTTMTTAASSILFAVAASIAQSASTLTHTFSGLATEDADAGGNNGTVSSQTAFAHDTVGVSVEFTVGATMSATINAGACLVAAFRGKIDGE